MLALALSLGLAHAHQVHFRLEPLALQVQLQELVTHLGHVLDHVLGARLRVRACRHEQRLVRRLAPLPLRLHGSPHLLHLLQVACSSGALRPSLSVVQECSTVESMR